MSSNSKAYFYREACGYIGNIETEYAKERFRILEASGVICEGSFKSDSWKMYDEYSYTGIHFQIDTESYRKNYMGITGIGPESFTEKLKAYVALRTGELVLSSLQSVVNDVKRLVASTPSEAFRNEGSLFLSHPARVCEFLSMISDETNSEEIDILSDMIERRLSWKGAGSQRKLASFESYLLFNDIINDYWNSGISDDERLFYYPLYLWWKISGIIPLRPREFILTPKECLEKRSDGWHIRLRRNRLKGAGRGVTYRIEEDYYMSDYRIPDSLASDIMWYTEHTEGHAENSIDTVFRTDAHYMRWDQKRHSNSRYLTYVNLRCIMRYFYRYVIEEKYGLETVYDRGEGTLDKGCIEYMYLGDTRHIALINIIAEEGTPVAAMALAGHDSINMASHYYSNITSLIECRIYRQYRKLMQTRGSYSLSREQDFLPQPAKPELLSGGGRCFSERFRNGDFAGCTKAAGPYGEIGYCRECEYYRSGHDNEYFEADSDYKRKIMEDCRYLEKVVSAARKSRGCKEDILPALMRLQASSLTYQKYLEEKMREKGDNENGKKGKD